MGRRTLPRVKHIHPTMTDTTVRLVVVVIIIPAGIMQTRRDTYYLPLYDILCWLSVNASHSCLLRGQLR